MAKRKLKIQGAEKRDIRRRSYAGVIYPESMPDDWDEYLTSLHIKILLSPLHDKDLNPDHELKKSHYHILAMFDGGSQANDLEAEGHQT